MTDRRVTTDPERVDRHEPARITQPVVDLCSAPGGARDRQLLYGERATILGTHAELNYIRAEKDGYIGFVLSSALGSPQETTHQVTALATHAYESADFKSAEQATLSFGSCLSGLSEGPRFLETEIGFIPKQHIAPVGWHARDPVSTARLFIGTPYLWGGNSRLGLDCSGLVQAALLSCGVPCPGDSDQQMAALGSAFSGPVRPGDLYFWRGHVAMAATPDTLIHANAHAMATVFEPLESALSRIAATDGPLLAQRRL